MKKRVRRGDPQKLRYWEAVVQRWREGGQSVRAFCRTEGLQESAFYFWRRKLAQHAHGTRDPGARKRMHDDASGSRAQAHPTMPALRSSGHDPMPSFLPVQVVGSASGYLGVTEAGYPLAGGGVEIALAQGRTVRVRAGFDRQTLADVLAMLEARPC